MRVCVSACMHACIDACMSSLSMRAYMYALCVSTLPPLVRLRVSPCGRARTC
jgi:hypothetical protein